MTDAPNIPESPVPPLDDPSLALLAELAAHPHDALIRRVLSGHLNAAAALFRSRMSVALAASIDWTTLALVPSSFVKRNLKQTHSDLLFSVRRNGKPILIYLLFEHQSTVDSSMPLRLLGYMLEIWLAHRQLNPTGPLPPVIPIVLNQGPGEWTVSTQFADMFRDLGEQANSDLDELLPFLPHFRHGLVDLSISDPREEMQDVTLKTTLYLMQQARVAKGL